VYSRVFALTGKLLLLVVTAASFLLLNFDVNFLRLHRLVFDSSNWVLPPYSVTAQVFPLRYFMDFFFAYGLLIACFALMCLMSAFLVRKWANGCGPYRAM